MTGPGSHRLPDATSGPGPVPATGATPDSASPAASAPVDPHRPTVDGRPDDRPESERRADMEELRGELGDTVQELVHRVDVPARVRAQREETATRARAQLARAQSALDEKAPAVSAAARERPGVFAGALLSTLAALLLVLRRARRNRRPGRGGRPGRGR